MSTRKMFVVKLHKTVTESFIVPTGVAVNDADAQYTAIHRPELCEGPAIDLKETVVVTEVDDDIT